MWDIIIRTTNFGPITSILFKRGTDIVSPNGPLAGDYVLAFPSLGYVTLTDNGNREHGGDWSVRFSGATNGNGNWFYSGGGKAQIDVGAGGAYTVSGGSGANVVGQLTPWFPA